MASGAKYDELVKYLLVVRKEVKAPEIDTALAYAIDQLGLGGTRQAGVGPTPASGRGVRGCMACPCYGCPACTPTRDDASPATSSGGPSSI